MGEFATVFVCVCVCACALTQSWGCWAGRTSPCRSTRWRWAGWSCWWWPESRWRAYTGRGRRCPAWICQRWAWTGPSLSRDIPVYWTRLRKVKDDWGEVLKTGLEGNVGQVVHCVSVKQKESFVSRVSVVLTEVENEQNGQRWKKNNVEKSVHILDIKQANQTTLYVWNCLPFPKQMFKLFLFLGNVKFLFLWANYIFVVSL